MEAYLFKYHRRFIFCLCGEKEKSQELYSWVNHDDSFCEYGFSREIKRGEINGFSYLMVEVLDHSSDNREEIKKQLNKEFNIQLIFEDPSNSRKNREDLNIIFGLSLERIVELHK